MEMISKPYLSQHKEHSLIIPAFLVSHRRYPVYIYVFAINLYSVNPKLGQRKVAEETRKKFSLKTFAHTTVGRAMKKLAQTLAETAIIDNKAMEDANAAQETEQNRSNTVKTRSGRFPTVQDTSTIRDTVKSFFGARLENRFEEEFREVCDRIAIYWYAHFHRLLMNTAPVFGRKLSSVTQSA